MATNPIAHLRSKVRALFTLEDKLTPEEKANQQWQLLTQVSGLNLIVGKGGVNTAFYVLGDNERQICYPQDLLDFLETLSKAKFPVYKVMYSRSRIEGVYTSEKEAKASPVLDGAFIVGVTFEGKLKKLYSGSKGLMKKQWLPIK